MNFNAFAQETSLLLQLQRFTSGLKLIMKTATLLITILFLLNSAGFTQPGTLDESFGENGKVICEGFGYCNTSALQADGKIITAGNSGGLVGNGFLLVRYNNDGSVDKSFGDNGKVITTGSIETGGIETIFSIAIQPDNKIVATGVGYKGYLFDGEYHYVNNLNFILARYLPDGKLDSSFGRNGISMIDFGIFERLYAVVLQPDDRIVVGGSSSPNATGIEDFLVARYMPDGLLDESFGDGGKVITDLNSANRDIIKSLVLQPDGKIVAGGISTNVGSSESSKFALARYNSDGNLDAEFGNRGTVVTDFAPNDDELTEIALQSDGKIVAVGRVGSLFGFNVNMGVARYTSTGSLDESFGNGGKVTIKFSSGASVAQSVAIQHDDKILVGGIAGGFALTRINTDGTLDSDFGENGTVVTPLGGEYYEGINCLVQENHKIVLTGTSVLFAQPYYNFALVRYNGDPVENPLISQVETWIKDNAIGWYTQNADKVGYYAVEASKTMNNFQEVKRITTQAVAQPPGNEQKIYSYVISNAETNMYYRIKAALLSGKSVYSDVLYYSGSESAIKIYPNPVKNTLHVTGLQTSANTTLTIVNPQGNVFKTVSITNKCSADINVNELKQGTYYLQIKHGTLSKKFTFLKE